jgi:phage protein U
MATSAYTTGNKPEKVKARTVGAFGDITFKVSSKTIRTIEKLELNGSVEYGTHKLHNGKTQLEYTGRNPVKGSFPIILSAFVNVNPRKYVQKLERYMNKGKVVPFILGTKKIGKKWVITSVKQTYEYFDPDGDVLSIECEVSIQEYN